MASKAVAAAVVFAVLALSAFGEAVAEDFYSCLPGMTDSPGGELCHVISDDTLG